MAGTSGQPSKDQAVVSLLEGFGYAVSVVDDDALSLVDWSGVDAAVVMSSVNPTVAGRALRMVPVPLVVGEAYAFDELGLVVAGGRSAEVAGNQVQVVDSGHPIAAGLAGTVVVQSVSGLGYAVPVPEAQVVAKLPGVGDRAAVFALETGAALSGGGVAPARRVGWFLTWNGTDTLTDQGASFLTALNHPGSGGDSVYWFPTPAGVVCWAA
ncbi:MAG: hypothetical protein R2715_25170 [Ilumatobacteraceae bacterium]